MSLHQVAKLIAQRLRSAKGVTDAHYPPALTGQNATDFTENVETAASNSVDALTYDFFDGITPATLPKPPGFAWIDWYDDMASKAEQIVNLSSPTHQQKQNAADYYKSIDAHAQTCIDEYTCRHPVGG